MQKNTEITSPCIRNCTLNDEDICVGCFRSLDEILVWANASNEERRLIMLETGKRKP